MAENTDFAAITLKMFVIDGHGAVCKSKSEPDGFLSEPVKLNTDGVAIFLSSQDGIWPFFFFVDVNELSLLLR